MSKKIATKQENALSQDLSEWGETRVTSKDMVIPKILPLQHMSEKVAEKLGEYGDFRDTLSNTKFGDLETPFEVIPFLMQKKWMEFQMVPQKNGGVKREFLQTVLIQDNPLVEGFNDDLPLRDEAEGIERDRVMDFFVLIPGEVESGEALPYVLSFRRTSLKCGQKMATQMYVKNRAANKAPASVVMEMSGKSKSNDDGTFVVQDVAPKRVASDKEIAEALKWYKIIKQGGAKVDDSDLRKEAVEVQANMEDENEF